MWFYPTQYEVDLLGLCASEQAQITYSWTKLYQKRHEAAHMMRDLALSYNE